MLALLVILALALLAGSAALLAAGSGPPPAPPPRQPPPPSKRAELFRPPPWRGPGAGRRLPQPDAPQPGYDVPLPLDGGSDELPEPPFPVDGRNPGH